MRLAPNRNPAQILAAMIGLCLLEVASVRSQNLVTVDSLDKEYSRIELTVGTHMLNGDRNYDYFGFYAWGVSYFLRDEVIMYESTHEMRYLTDFTRIGDTVMNNRDDVRGLKDWRGESQPGWSSKRRWDPKLGRNTNDGPPVRDLMDDASIVYPFLSFAKVVFGDSMKLQGLKAKAREYLSVSERIIEVHIDEEWDSALTCFMVPKGSPFWSDGANVPNNYEAQVGSDLLLLFELTGNNKYRDMVVAIAKNFKEGLTISDSSYIWHYWNGVGYQGWTPSEHVSTNTPSYGGATNLEDISHGAIDLSFLLDCYDNGVVFDHADMLLLTNTFFKILDKGAYISHDLRGLADPIAGKGFGGPFFWIRLSRFNPSVYYVFYDIFFRGQNLPDDITSANLVANLARYYPRDDAAPSNNRR